MAEGSTQAVRNKALKELRQKRAKVSPAPSTTSNASESAAPDRVTSRFFPHQPSSTTARPKILIPDSSPSGSPVRPTPPVYKPHAGHGVPLTRPTPKPRPDEDLLTASGFRSSSMASSSSVHSASALPPVHYTGAKDADRPRKRVNTGSNIMSTSSPVSIHRPTPSSSTSLESSPQVSDARHEIARFKLDSAAASSDDDDFPDLSDIGGRRRRVVRGRAEEPTASPEVTHITSSPEKRPSQEELLQELQRIAPETAREHLRVILQEEEFDFTRAKSRLETELDMMRQYEAQRPASVTTGSVSNGASTLRVTVFHPSTIEAVSSPTVKGNKKSAIYAKRATMESVRTPVYDVSRPSSSTPALVKRKRRGDESDEDSIVEIDGLNGMAKGKGKSRDSDFSDDEDDADEDALLFQRQVEGVLWFNTATTDELIELTSCTQTQAQTIVSIRPFDDHDDLRAKFTKKKGISYKLFETYISVIAGYGSLDDLLRRCQHYGKTVSKIVNKWSGADMLSGGPSKAPSNRPSRAPSESADSDSKVDDAGIHLTQVSVANDDDPDMEGYIRVQPALMNEDVRLKDYQMIGLNWLNLLWSKKMSCILADEMGLGKTIQVIAFLAHLKDTKYEEDYHHLIIVPPSTLENWVREFERFAPNIEVQTYYGTQMERAELRQELLNARWDVLVTTYNFAQGNEHDRKFFRKIRWEVCVFDEGHMLKNFQSQRYEHLMKIRAHWRLLLTGTPLQNNLQELVSLLNFIMPDLFVQHEESLRAIFKAKADSRQSFLSRDRVTRAKKMMTPFVLRRRKDQVLKDLPRKTERIEWCEMTQLQRTIYKEALQRSRKTIQTVDENQPAQPEVKTKGKTKMKSKIGASNGDTSSNVLMDLRKAACHPMLFRRLFDDGKIKLMAKHCLKEPEFCDSNYNYVVEDMEVMTDAELQFFCKRYKSVNKHALDDECYLAAGKITRLLKLLDRYKSENKRVLIFSQFVQILDILRAIFDTKKVRYLVLTGSTAVDERQGLVDKFNEDEGIPVFLLSTKAGGMGINLTAACVVIIFDQDFNPHNDKQACDRAYRIGQKRDVEIVKMITKGTIEEDIHRIGNTKLMLDDAVAGDREEEGESAPEKLMKSSLLSTLRQQFENEQDNGVDSDVVMEDRDPTKTNKPSSIGKKGKKIPSDAEVVSIPDSDVEEVIMDDADFDGPKEKMDSTISNTAIVV